MNRDTTRLLAIVFVTALAARLLYLFEFHRSVFFGVPILDAAWHDQWARRIAAGHWLDGAPYFRAPCYAWFLAVIDALSGGGAWAPRLVQALLGAATATAAAWCGLRLVGRRAGLAAGLIVALYGPLIFAGGELLHETLVTALITGALVALVHGQLELDDPDAGALPWFVAALLLGFAAITRPNALALAPVLLATPWITSRRAALTGRARRLVAPVLFGLLLPILPVTAINFIASGDLVWIASQGGINFYAGNNAAADGRSVVVPELSGTGGWEDFVPRVREIAEKAEGKALRPSEVSAWWADRGRAWLQGYPGDAAALYGRKLSALLGGYEIPNNRDINVARRESLLLAILVGHAGPVFYPWALLLPLAAIGLVMAPDRRRLFPVWGTTLLFALSLLPFFLCDRFRLPLVPLLAIPAGLGLVTLAGLRHPCRQNRIAIGIGVAALLVTFPAGGIDTGGHPADAWHKLGEALYNRGDYQAALEAFDQALRIAPDDPAVRLARAYALQGVGSDSLAETELQIVAGQLPDSWQAQYGYGLRLFRTGRVAGAIPYLEKAAGLMPERAELHRDLGFAYQEAGRWREAGLALTQALKLGLENAEIHLSLGLAALQLGRAELAESNWQRALELDPRHFRSLYNLGLLRFGQGRNDEAAELWQRAGDVDPKSPLVPWQLARLASRRGDGVVARARIGEAVRLGLSYDRVTGDPLLAPYAPAADAPRLVDTPR